MKIVRDELISVLDELKVGMIRNDLVEYSNLFVFSDGIVGVYSDDIVVFKSLPGIDFSGGVDSDSLFLLLRKLKTKKVEMSVSDGELIVISGCSKAGLKLIHDLDIVEYWSNLVSGLEWIEVGDGFKDSLVFASFSCSKDMSVPILTCVCVDGDFVISSDNFRATKKKINCNGMGKVLIPAKSIKKLSKYNGLCGVSVNNGWMFFRFENDLVFSCRIFEADFPDIDHLFEFDGFEAIFPDELIETVDRAKIFSKVISSELLDEHIAVVVDSEIVVIKSSGDIGWFEEKLEIKNDIDSPIEFLIHPQFFQEVLNKVNKGVVGDDRIRFSGDDWEHVVALVGGSV